MYATFGPHTHPDNEANLVKFDAMPVLSPRGQRIETRYRAYIQGELLYDGQAALHPKIAELIDAYGRPNQSFTFYHDDGTPTRHRIPANDPNNVTGVNVIHRDWPKGDAAEYATTRTFFIVLEAFFADLESPGAALFDWKQDTETIGIAGIGRRWVTYTTGAAEEQIVAQQTTQKLIQTGYAVGYFDYPTSFIPGPLHPELELTDLRRIRRRNPRFRGVRNTHYRVDWTYVMETPAFKDITPGEPVNT